MSDFSDGITWDSLRASVAFDPPRHVCDNRASTVGERRDSGPVGAKSVRNSLLFASVALGLLGAAGADDDALKQEYQKFEGTWKFESFESNGMKADIEQFKEFTLELKGDQFTSKDRAGTTHGTFKVDPSVTPKTIEIVFSDGPPKGMKLVGIYKLEGDLYTVCLAEPGRDRPTEFSAKAGSGWVLEVLKRQKP
jgi:uncharacterized protein (TIGR03067 family)